LKNKLKYEVPGDILKLGGEVMTPFLARLLEISLKNATISSDWKKKTLWLLLTKW